ncbi:MAG: hypothetical protein QXF56_05080 [Candidatus Micrarchaeia archaeon]
MKLRVVLAFLLLSFLASAFTFYIYHPTTTETVFQEQPVVETPEETQAEYLLEPPPGRVEQYTEPYCIIVPYTTEECTYENLLHTEEGECYLSGWNQSWTNSECTIKNTDTIGSNFIIYTGFEITPNRYLPKGKWFKNRQIGINESVYIGAGSSKTIRFSQQLKLNWDEKFAGCYCYATSVVKRKTCTEVSGLRKECQEVVKYRLVE